jgi:phosphate uptake regulator
MSEDGRNGVEDARQEAGDLLQYAFKVYLTGDKKGLNELVELTRAVTRVIENLSRESE